MESAFRDERQDIADLVHRYAFYIRNRQAALCVDLFAPDAVFDILEVNPLEPDSRQIRRGLRGREAIGDYVVNAQASGVRICPLISNLLVEIEGPKAVSHSIMHSRTWPAGHEVVGQYDDQFIRHEGEWLFQSRTFTLFTSPRGVQADSRD